MKKERRVIVSILWILLGLILLGLGFARRIDEFWSSMGTAFLFVGVLQIIRFNRWKKDEAYREKMEVEIQDERNHFIRNKAWAWAGYIFVLVSAVGVIILRAVGQELLSFAAAIALGMMLLLYWGAYFILKRKY